MSGMIINTNISAINAQRNLSKTNSGLETAMQRLSSGLRVNSAKDDAAGLAISDRMTAQIRGMTVAARNASDGISIAQTTEAAMGQMTEMLQRMRDLAVQAANFGAVGSGDREKLNDEFKQLGLELKRTIDNTSFNGKQVLNGSLKAVKFQVGFSTASHNQIAVSINSMTKMSGLSQVISDVNLSIGSTATSTIIFSAINAIDIAIRAIDADRSRLGAAQNRFTFTIANLQSSIENNSAARSRIIDADFAAETSKLSKNQILQQAGTAMLAQANQSKQGVLSLLQ